MHIEQIILLVQSRERDSAFIGMYDAEISEVCKAQDVSGLPIDYAHFLRLAGKQAGSFNRGTEMFYPWLLTNKQHMMQELVEQGVPFELPARAFVFSCHQGYNYWYFEDATGDPPVAVNWYDTDAQPRRLFRTFSDWLTAEVEIRREAESLRMEYTDKGLRRPQSSISYEQFRTIPPASET